MIISELMLKIALRVFILMIVLPVGMGASFYWLNEAGFFQLENMEVVVKREPDQEKFLRPRIEALQEKMQKWKGLSLWDLPLTEISRQLDAEPWIQSARLSRQWPNQLEVDVEPFQVRALFYTSKGDLRPILENGMVLAPIVPQEAPDVVIVSGKDFEKEAGVRQSLLELLSEIPAQGRLSHRTIAEIRFDEKEGFWATLVESGLKVKLGHEQFSMKASRVSQVLEYIDQKDLQARVIDANLSKKVLVRLRKAP